ncbi:MAG: calcium/sodium antiporter [Acidimicrobiia bacterium]|nr:calcium/sodium antiporter [Acidimicrobiia bacterium]MCY4456622.1 calcium/sodium antiporter [Acidimicrobiaceae bacterium]
MIGDLIYSIGGLAMLAVASDQFVKGAVRLAVVMRVAPVIVGSVVVGFGTSAPEMVVSAVAAADDNLDIGVGNIIGSNVANISLVLGCATLLASVPVQRATLRREVPISVGSVLLFAALLQGELSRLEGLVLIVVLVTVLGYVLQASRREQRVRVGEEISDLVGEEAPSTFPEVVRTTMALSGVVIAAWLVVTGAEGIADELDLTGGFIGFTLVAVGTSAPELFTAVAAARRNEIELLIGNLLGSNMFNSLAVGGAIALVGPGQPEDGDLVVWGSVLMVAVVLASAIVMITKRRVARLEGFFLVVAWMACVAILRAL